jgi:IS1 family transposase
MPLQSIYSAGVRRKTTLQRLKESIKENKIEVEVELALQDNRSSFNFILKEHNNGIIYMGSQIDTCFYIVFTDQ